MATTPKAMSAPVGGPSRGPVATAGGAGLIANNAGTLSGAVMGPSASLIANNAGNILSNNGGGIISNNGASYALLQAARLTPVAGGRVEVTDPQGVVLSLAPATTGADGRFTIERLKPSGPVVIVRVTYRLADRAVTMAAAVPAPRRAGGGAAAVTPASTLVAAKVQQALTSGRQDAQAIAEAGLDTLAGRLEAAMSDRAIAEALLLPATEAVRTFDRILREQPALAGLAGPLIADSAPPSAAPGATPSTGAGASAAPSPGASASPSPTPTPTPSATPWPTRAYLVRRVAGSAVGGMTAGANRLADTFTRIGGLVVTPADAYILADPDTHQIRRLPATGAGQRIAGMADGSAGFNGQVTLATNTPLNQPHGVAYDAVAGDVYVCDTGNDRVRHLAGGSINTRVGGGTDTGDTVALATDARLSAPMGLARDGAGHLFFTERTTSRVRRYDAVTKRLTTLATGAGDGPIALDDANDVVWVAKGDVVTALSNINGASATLAATSTFQAPAGAGSPQVTGLAYDGAGTLYVAQATLPGAGGVADARVYRVSVDASGRATSTPELIAGTGGQDGSPAAYAVPTTDTNGPTQLLAGASWCGLTVGADGRLYAGNSYPGQWGQVLRLAPAP
jgi:hypothetical protein